MSYLKHKNIRSEPLLRYSNIIKFVSHVAEMTLLTGAESAREHWIYIEGQKDLTRMCQDKFTLQSIYVSVPLPGNLGRGSQLHHRHCDTIRQLASKLHSQFSIVDSTCSILHGTVNVQQDLFKDNNVYI